MMAGGSSQAKTTDWSPRGRDVIRWADNDVAGVKWTAHAPHWRRLASGRQMAIPPASQKAGTARDANYDEVKALIGDAKGVPATARLSRPSLCLFLSHPTSANDAVYHGLPTQQGASITAGEGGSGKSAMHRVEVPGYGPRPARAGRRSSAAMCG